MAERQEAPDAPGDPARASAGPHQHAADSAFQQTHAHLREQARRDAKNASLVDKGKAAVKSATTLKERFDHSQAGRTLERVKDGNGMVLAGGIAYFSLTSIAAVIVIAVTLASVFVSRSSEWNDRLFSVLDEAIPGVVGDGADGLVNPTDIEPQTITGIVGLATFLVLINTATRYLRGMRVGVRTMLGKEAAPPAQGKLRDFMALLALGLIVVLGLALQLLASQFAQVMASWFTVEWVSEGIIRTPAIVVGLFLDMAFVAIAVVVLGRYKGPRKPLVKALVVAAVAMGILRQAVSLVVASVGQNAVLGSVAAVITILIFVDIIARIVLLCAAWLGASRDVQREDPELEDHTAEAQPRQSGPGVTTRRSTTRTTQ